MIDIVVALAIGIIFGTTFITLALTIISAIELFKKIDYPTIALTIGSSFILLCSIVALLLILYLDSIYRLIT